VVLLHVGHRRVTGQPAGAGLARADLEPAQRGRVGLLYRAAVPLHEPAGGRADVGLRVLEHDDVAVADRRRATGGLDRTGGGLGGTARRERRGRGPGGGQAEGERDAAGRGQDWHERSSVRRITSVRTDV
jgi:hypothetical protein